MPIEFLISALVTLLVVVDPMGLVPSYSQSRIVCLDPRTAAWRSAPL